MAVKIVKKEQIKGRVDVVAKDGSLEKTEEIILGEVIVSDDTPMAQVGVKLGTTKNLGDFEFLRVDVSLYMPSETDKKSLNKAFKKCFKWTEDKLAEIMIEADDPEDDIPF